MSDVKWTPGPWVTEAYVDYTGLSVIASDDASCISNPSRGQVCHISIVAGASGGDPDRARANARLIAAAPDLYAALAWVRACYLPDDQSDMVKAIDAALDLARKGSPSTGEG